MENSKSVIKIDKGKRKYCVDNDSHDKKLKIKSSKHLKRKRNWKYTKFGRKYRIKSTLSCSSLTKCCKKKMKHKFTFTFASYNILAPALVDENFHLYVNVDEQHLDWNYRRTMLMNEIEYHNSDIYCFQEMQKDQYYDYFYPRLKQLGYYCLYKKRNGNKPDGCCIAFKKRKFNLILNEAIEFYQSNVETLNRENVAIIALLQPKYGPTHERLCVATTHILFSPKRGDIKLAQMQTLLANIDRIAFKNLKITNNGVKNMYYPIILCGDMNSLHNSPFLEFMLNSKLLNYVQFNQTEVSGQRPSYSNFVRNLSAPLVPQHLDITDQSQFKNVIDKRLNKFIANDNDRLNLNNNCPQYTFGTENLYHPFSFKSAYEYFDKYGNQLVTTCLPDSHELVDFIFYTNYLKKNSSKNQIDSKKSGRKNNDSENISSSGSLSNNNNNNVSDDENDCELQIVSTLKLFTKDEVKHAYFPNKHYASDHFLLAAKFLLTSNS